MNLYIYIRSLKDELIPLSFLTHLEKVVSSMAKSAVSSLSSFPSSFPQISVFISFTSFIILSSYPHPYSSFLLVCFLFCFLLFRAAPVAYGHSQARGRNQSYSCWPIPQPQQHGIWAMSVSMTYTTAHGNAGSPTHLKRLGIEPASRIHFHYGNSPYSFFFVPFYFMFILCPT